MNIGQTTSFVTLNKTFFPPRPSFAQPNHSDDDIDNNDNNSTASESAREPSSPPASLAPFPRNSVNLISCSSNSGKTHFLDQVIRHRDRFFSNPESISRLVYVNGNQRDFTIQHPWSEQFIDLEVIALSLDEFANYTTVLQSNDILILDDTLKLNEDIEFIVKYGAHHYALAAVFIVTQSCLSSPLYSLIASVHTIVLLFGNTQTTRLAQHLVQTFFLCSETKKYLKSIFGLAEKQQDIVILKLNSIASNPLYSSILALCQVRHLLDPLPFCIVYPELGHLDTMASSVPSSASAQLAIQDSYLNEAFVLLPASRVNVDKPDTMLCGDEKEAKWNDMARLLENDIESAFQYRKWTSAKNLAREMLLCNQLCFSENARTVRIHNKPKIYSVIDFLHAATRKAGPGERPDKVAEYRPLMQVLLRNNVPHSFIINKLLLPGGGYSESFREPTRHVQSRRRHYFDE